MSDTARIWLQHVLPKQALTRLAGRVARARGGALTTQLIRSFVAHYGVAMDEAAEPDISRYATFNEFFTRPLRAGARPIAGADLVSPVDGAISQLGPIEDTRIIQAKGHDYSIGELLGGDEALASRFRHGSFANLYLAPRDYHRLHMPCAGTLRRMVHVPGALFSVNPVTARGVPGLFARNERVICVFDSPRHGPFALVLVGATIVGSIATTWHGIVNETRTGAPVEWDYTGRTIALAKGEEFARFLLGSTIVMLFPPGAIAFAPDWVPERAVRLGESMGRRPARPRSG